MQSTAFQKICPNRMRTATKGRSLHLKNGLARCTRSAADLEKLGHSLCSNRLIEHPTADPPYSKYHLGFNSLSKHDSKPLFFISPDFDCF